MADTELVERLKTVEAFSCLHPGTLSALQARMRQCEYSDGAVLCREGEAGDRMYVIHSGEVVVTKRSDAGSEVELAMLGPGDVAGEMSLFGCGARTATLTARGAISTWELEHDTFQHLLAEEPQLARGLLDCLHAKLVKQSSMVARLLTRDIDRRFKVVFFDSKPYMEAAFRACNDDEKYNLCFFEPKLTVETAPMAAGSKAVCVFVNDDLNAEVVGELDAMGVEMIALRCAGYNNVDLGACTARGISVARVPAYSPYAVAEHAVALMMALNRKVHRAYNRVRDSNFSLAGLVGFDMHGRTAGVVGTGKIGQCLVSILHGFGCRVLAYDLYPNEELRESFGVEYVPLERLWAEADLISLHAPLTEETHHLVDAAAIARMKPGAMLINTSRGGLVDSEALIEGLKSGQLGAAGLDVYEEESAYFFEDLSDQVITDDLLARLTTFNNVIVTSHQGFLTEEALQNIAETTLANIAEFEAGQRAGDLTNGVTA